MITGPNEARPGIKSKRSSRNRKLIKWQNCLLSKTIKTKFEAKPILERLDILCRFNLL